MKNVKAMLYVNTVKIDKNSINSVFSEEVNTYLFNSDSCLVFYKKNTITFEKFTYAEFEGP